MNDYFTTLGQKFLRAGWADGIIDKPDEFKFSYTTVGIENLKLLHAILAKIDGKQLSDKELELLRELAYYEGTNPNASDKP
jgi:hypothetical protein